VSFVTLSSTKRTIRYSKITRTVHKVEAHYHLGIYLFITGRSGWDVSMTAIDKIGCIYIEIDILKF